MNDAFFEFENKKYVARQAGNVFYILEELAENDYAIYRDTVHAKSAQAAKDAFVKKRR